jgi:hypothetical protein
MKHYGHWKKCQKVTQKCFYFSLMWPTTPQTDIGVAVEYENYNSVASYSTAVTSWL